MVWKDEESFVEVIEAWKRVNEAKRQRGAMLLWHIWGRRNDKVFNGKDVPHAIIADCTKKLVADHNQYTTKSLHGCSRLSHRSAKKWVAPPLEYVKINCDATLQMTEMGVIVSYAQGHAFFTASRRVRSYWEPLIGEGNPWLWL